MSMEKHYRDFERGVLASVMEDVRKHVSKETIRSSWAHRSRGPMGYAEFHIGKSPEFPEGFYYHSDDMPIAAIKAEGWEAALRQLGVKGYAYGENPKKHDPRYGTDQKLIRAGLMKTGPTLHLDKGVERMLVSGSIKMAVIDQENGQPIDLNLYGKSLRWSFKRVPDAVSHYKRIVKTFPEAVIVALDWEGASSFALEAQNPQKVTGKETAIKHPLGAPRLHRRMYEKYPDLLGEKVLDLGGGPHDDAIHWFAQRGIDSMIIDPHWRSDEHNEAVAAAARARKPDSVLISNVLNVIDNDADRQKLIQDAFDFLPRGRGAFFTVYEGDAKDRKRGARETGPGKWQEFRLTDTYIPEIAKVFGKAYVTTLPGDNKIIAAQRR